MILQLEAAAAEGVKTARADLQSLATSWGYELTEVTSAAPQPNRDERSVDPVALSALILSLPSVAMATLDLADRIRKRRRADELIQHARALAERRIALRVLARRGAVDLSTLTSDQLLELLGDEGS